MNYCKRCFYPANHPLHITFDDDGVCSGCRVHEERDTLDWEARKQKLIKLLESYRNQNSSNYDCLIPVSGGRDSYFIVHTIKKELGLNPLLVSYNKHYNTQIGIRNLAYLKTLFDCDILTQQVSPASVKRITQVTFKTFGSMYWHCLAGQTAFPVQIAVRLKIPLIVWGMHQGCDQVGMYSHTDEVEMTRKYRKEHDLMGYEASDLLKMDNNLTEKELRPFFYPTDVDIANVGVRGIYLSNYIRWDTKAQHEKMIELYNYETLEQTRTFDCYNDIDCFNYSDVHDYIKWIKCGYGKATDHATRELRLKRLTRADGLQLIEKYQNKKPQNLKLFLDWLEISEKDFEQTLESFRNLDAWQKNSQDQWELINQPSDDKSLKDFALTTTSDCTFKTNGPKVKKEHTDGYELIGKGFIHD